MTRDKISLTVETQVALLGTFLPAQKELLNEIANQLVAAFHRGGRLFICGVGPFGAIASLIGQTFLYRQTLDRPALPAIALTNDAGLATFLAAEDQGEQVFSRQLRALATPRDMVLLLAGAFLSRADQEVINTARQLDCRTILVASKHMEITGSLPDTILSIPSDSEPRLLECTLCIGNLLCSLVESELFGI